VPNDSLEKMLYGEHKKIQPCERKFEFRGSEYKTGRTFQIDFKIKPSEILEDPAMVRQKLLKEIENLLTRLIV
jgi:hypothetical protein